MLGNIHVTNEDRYKTVKHERDTFAALAFCAADVLMQINRRYRITFIKGATASILGHRAEDMIGTSLLRLAAESSKPLIRSLFERARFEGRLDREPVEFLGPDGAPVRLRLSGYTLDPLAGDFYLTLHQDPPATAEVPAPRARDAASGLLAQESFAALASERASEARARGQEVSLTLLDLPQLPELTRSMNANRREALLQTLGATVRASSVGGDTATHVSDGRYSLMHHAEIDLDQVRARLTEATRQADPTGVGAEVRHATVEVDSETPIDEADFTRGVVFMLNKFGDESGGEGALQTLTSMNNIVEMAVSEVESFRQIVRDDAFFLAFQPIVSIKTGSVHHFEALCRFQDLPPGVSPFQQIQFAEETGMIAELDLAVVHKVIGLLAQRPRSAAPIKVAVNVSGVSVGSDAYVTGLWKLLDYNRWTRGQLLFEITESARMSDLACANTFIQGLRERGYKVCLDDLGAGAASFRYLSALDVDMVKLDGSAVRNARKAAKGRAFLSALAELCRRLGTETVAEMIEDEQGLSFARQCGVDFVQGYLFGRPSPNLKDFEPLPNATIFQRVRRDAATASR